MKERKLKLSDHQLSPMRPTPLPESKLKSKLDLLQSETKKKRFMTDQEVEEAEVTEVEETEAAEEVEAEADIKTELSTEEEEEAEAEEAKPAKDSLLPKMTSLRSNTRTMDQNGD